MKFQAPHWLTAIASGLGVVCGSLAATNAFPAYTGLLAGLAGLCALLAGPTIKQPSPLAPAPLPKDVQ